MKPTNLYLTIALCTAAAIAFSSAALERRLEKETLRQLALQRPGQSGKPPAKTRAGRKLGNTAQSKLRRLIKALKAIRSHRSKSLKQKAKKHKARRHKAKKHKGKKVTKRHRKRNRQRRHLAEEDAQPASEDNSGVLEKGGQFLENTAESVGNLTGYIPEKMGFDYSKGGDYLATGLGAIGFSYGLWDYYTRRRNSKEIFKVLGDRYNINGLQNAALEQENSNLVYINKKLIYTNGKVDRTKKSIETRVHELDNPLFT